jgi:hypothetical protein
LDRPIARNEPLQIGWHDLLRHLYERSLSSRFVQGMRVSPDGNGFFMKPR